ncbi:MAG: hypothetical protein HY646_09440 [Acidobacteria bacterium]|nr:hypothetical protein [Acidobacteriota bacterium]
MTLEVTMGIDLRTSGLSDHVRESIRQGILTAIAEGRGDWTVSIVPDPVANAWDVEAHGPNGFYWSRRFSGGDRDASVISEAIRDGIAMFERSAA